MNLTKAFYFLISLLLAGGIAIAQQQAAPPAPPADIPSAPDAPDAPRAFTMFFSGGSFLGVYAEDINRENMARYGMREARGVGITQVMKDSPAEKAGLRKDDVIVRFEGDSVTSTRKLNRMVSEVAPDQTVKLGIARGGGEQEVAVTIGKRNDSFNTEHFKLEGLKGIEKWKGFEGNMPPGADVWKWEGGPGKDGMFFLGGGRRIGVGTMPLTKQLAEYFGIADGKGVLVTSVSEDGPAAKAGIKAGDVITAIDGEKVEGAGDVARGINKKKEGSVTLTVIRNKNQQTMTVTPKDAPMPAPGAVIGKGPRTIVIPGIELGEIPEMDIEIPRIELPSTPEIKVVVPRTIKGPKVRVAPRVRVITNGSEQPI